MFECVIALVFSLLHCFSMLCRCRYSTPTPHTYTTKFMFLFTSVTIWLLLSSVTCMNFIRKNCAHTSTLPDIVVSLFVIVLGFFCYSQAICHSPFLCTVWANVYEFVVVVFITHPLNVDSVSLLSCSRQSLKT